MTIRTPLRELTPVQAGRYLDRLLPVAAALAEPAEVEASAEALRKLDMT